MTAFSKGVAVAVIHLLLVLSVSGKFLYDRYHCPRVWVRTATFDPELPVRGRYFTLQVEVQAPWFRQENHYQREDVKLSVEDGQLIASRTDATTELSVSYWPSRSGFLNKRVFLDQGIPFFIPEHAAIPVLKAGQELWAEVTVPRKGPPRPIQLAIKNGKDWRPLNLP
jgi:hypothetical protein